MNHFTLRSPNGDDKSILIQSSLDASHFLPAKIHEEVQFDRDDLLIVKNKREDKQELRFCVKHMDADAADGRKAKLIVSSTRHATMTVQEGQELHLNIDGGEVLHVRSSAARNPTGNGAGLAV